MRPLNAFILAAGLGTRMGPLSQVLPKPAWPLGGRPLVLWGAEALQREGFTRVGCNVHHLSGLLEAAVGGAIEVFREPELLGSAGGLTHARDRATDPLAVWNGDAIAEVPWRMFHAEHLRLGAQLSWLLVPHDGGPWNPVWLDGEGRLLPPGTPGPQGPFHFTGASLWGREALSLLPGGPADTKAHILPRLTRHLGIVVEPFPWLEVGTPDQLIAAAALLAPQAEGRLPGCYLHPGSEGGPGLKRCILGPGVHLAPGFEDRDAFWALTVEGLQRAELPLPGQPA
nr:NTP transferase domain-containing protein [uncultured Holophaga sp.]